MSKLSIDILSIVFEELEKENSTLYSCIFVNREWCQVGIPFLWKNPWKIFNDTDWMNDNKYQDIEIRYKILFRSFLTLMTKEQKEFLRSNGIEFSLENSKLKNNKKVANIVNSNALVNDTYTIGAYFKSIESSDGSAKIQTSQLTPPSSQKSLFNYASFCKVIDSNKINLMVYHNIRESYPRYLNGYHEYHEYLVEQEIYKLLIENTSKLRRMSLSDLRHPIAFYPNSSISLSQLNELHCSTSIESTVFYGLSQLCRNIEKLVIEGYNDENDGLITFIKQQINLRKVKIYEDDEPYAQGKCRRIGYALITQSSSIKELDIGKTAITFPPLLLENFQNNLTVFKFGINYETIEPVLADELESVLKNISIPNLQQLIIYNYCPPFHIIGKIVEKSKGDLRKISVGAYAYDSDEGHVELISSIAKNCPKLEYLMVWVGKSMKELIELFKECKRLRGLVLHSLWRKKSAEELFGVMCDDVSKQLGKFKISGDWEISREALEEFLNKWKKQKRNSFDFYISKSFISKKKNYYVDIINKYKEMGVIRKYGYEEFIDYESCIDDNIFGRW